jgi:hypothetical protein
MHQFLILAAVAMMFSQTDAADSRYQCTSRQAEQEGYFQCLNGCDENHFVQGSSGPKKYCLSYFPNGGKLLHETLHKTRHPQLQR